MSEYQTSYYKFNSPSDEEQNQNEEAYLMHVPDRNRAHWHHIEDLDGFFARVYKYHQNHGFSCILLQQCFELIQFVFIVAFATFLLICVDYDILFANKLPEGFDGHNRTEKITLRDAVLSAPVCTAKVGENGLIVVMILIASCFWALQAVKVVYNVFKLSEIRRFYYTALKVEKDEIDNLTWHEVQQRLMLVQEEQQLCIHKQQITELDIYNRILRFKNYMVAMVNKGLLPPRFSLPIFGDVVFFTQALKYNIELIFFWGPRAVFTNSYHMRDQFKSKSHREMLAAKLSSDFLMLGIINLLLSPIILLWQILYSFFSYGEVLKREPGSFGARKWSMYSRLYLRHFNELPHEFQARLNRGYKPASSYMNSFNSPILTVLAKNVTFFVGSLLAVLLVLTVWDEDVLSVEHVLSAITLFTIVITICKSFIPDEHIASCPEHLMRNVIAQVHYAPDSWRNQAHTYQVMDQFAQLFQFKAVYILEELLSPIITPFLLIFWMRGRSLEIVDFFRNFTVDIAGVGDVCSFAQLDIKKHGDPKWHDTAKQEGPNYTQQADQGKTELSLMHFAVTNPKWIPPKQENQFLASIKVQARMDLNAVNDKQNPLLASLNSLGSVDMLPNSMLHQPHSIMMSTSQYEKQASNKGRELYQSYQKDLPTQQRPHTEFVRGAHVSEGPLERNNEGLISSLLSQGVIQDGSISQANQSLLASGLHRAMNGTEQRQDIAQIEMSVSALYMHELHHQRLSDQHARMMWDTIPDEPGTPGPSGHQDPGFNYSATGQTLSRADVFGHEPFLSVDVHQPPEAPAGFHNDVTEDDVMSSDSDAAPGVFHLVATEDPGNSNIC